MHLLSLETAKALKEAGLKWEPVLGDLFVADYDNGLGPTPLKKLPRKPCCGF